LVQALIVDSIDAGKCASVKLESAKASVNEAFSHVVNDGNEMVVTGVFCKNLRMLFVPLSDCNTGNETLCKDEQS
jgi:hypothetical protein